MTIPSRQFLIQQSCLNTMNRLLPMTLAAYGTSHAAREFLQYLKGAPEYSALPTLIRQEYKYLVAQYQ